MPRDPFDVLEEAKTVTHWVYIVSTGVIRESVPPLYSVTYHNWIAALALLETDFPLFIHVDDGA